MFLDLWTVQHASAWEKAEKTGLLLANGRRVPRFFRDPYLWMMWQMRSRLPEYEGHYPLWGWLKPKPDLRKAGYLSKGAPGVLLQVSVQADLVLLSEFNAWHAVLNRWYLALTEEEERLWESEWSAQADAAARIRASWERIFDLTALYHSPLYGPDQLVQATFESVEIDAVVSVKPFVAR